MSKVKAIETEYNGYKFRSRLEARWAVFFDAMGFDWVYEPEGYHLLDGRLYLPDFYICASKEEKRKMFIEVKPTEFTKEEESLCLQLTELTLEETGMLVGVPDYKIHNYWRWDSGDGSFGPIKGEFCFVRGKWGIFYEPGYDAETLRDINPDLQKAITEARQARFEHGQTPKSRKAA
jgi:hypothetical protein